jgi:hypothetical protein
MTHLSSTTRKCRKAACCDWCGQTIDAGTEYHSHVYRMDGDFHADKFHPECSSAMNLINWQWDDGFDPRENVRGKPEHQHEGEYELKKPWQPPPPTGSITM